MDFVEYPTYTRAHTTPDKIAVLGEGISLTYAALEQRVVAMARRLAGLGIGSGDRVVVVSRNNVDFVIVIHALPRIGAVLVPLSTRLTESELRNHFSELKPRLILTDAGSLSACRDSADGIAVYAIGEDSLPSGTRVDNIPTDQAAVPTSVDSEALHSIIYTSGTTGSPKGAMLTWRNHVASACQSAMNLGTQADDRWLASLPFYHVGGLAIVLRAAIDGVPIALCERFDAESLSNTIAKYDVTLVSLVGETLRRVVTMCNGSPPPSLRAILVGGGPLDRKLQNRAIDAGWPVLLTYGLTETASQAATQSPNDDKQQFMDSAPPLALTRIVIRNDNNKECAPCTIGRITISGPTLTSGYFNDPVLTAEAIRDGWLFAGDRGWLDEHGRLYVRGRIDDLIISAGVNIDPLEIATVLRKHPSVTETVVIGVSHPQWGQRPIAIVECRESTAPNEDALKKFVGRMLSRVKIPDQIFVMPELPRLENGKIDLRACRSFVSRNCNNSP